MTILDSSPHLLKAKPFALGEAFDIVDGRFTVWEEPIRGGTYVIGGDCAKGMERGDFDAAAVYIKPGERDPLGTKPRQVAELHGHWGERFDRLLYSTAMLYGGAFILLERQEGLSIMRRLWDEYQYTYIYYQRDPAQPNRKVRDALGHARVHDDYAMRNLMIAVRNGDILPRSRDFLDQARKLEWYKPGEEPGLSDRPTDASLKMRLPGGGSPDIVMAHVYANLALREVFHYDKPEDLFPKGSLGDIFGYEKVFAPTPSGESVVDGSGVAHYGRKPR